MSNDVSSLEFTPEYVYCRTCGKDYDSRIVHNHPERHEFHMLDADNAYCICGWEASNDWSNVTVPSFLGERYREHLGPKEEHHHHAEWAIGFWMCREDDGCDGQKKRNQPVGERWWDAKCEDGSNCGSILAMNERLERTKLRRTLDRIKEAPMRP